MRVEVPGVVHGPAAIAMARRQLGIQQRRLLVARVVECLRIALAVLERPVLRERERAHTRNQPEQVIEMVIRALAAGLAPVAELDRNLERRVAAPHPSFLGYTQEIEEHLLQVGYCGLADAD